MFKTRMTFLMAMLLCSGAISGCAVMHKENRLVMNSLDNAVQGSVIINTVVVRRGARVAPTTVGRRFEKGSFVDIPLVGVLPVTGFRISDAGRGSYRLLVR